MTRYERSAMRAGLGDLVVAINAGMGIKNMTDEQFQKVLDCGVRLIERRIETAKADRSNKRDGRAA